MCISKILGLRSEPFPTTPLSFFSAVLNRKLWLFLLRCPFSNLPKVVLHLLRAAQNSFNFFQHAKRNYGLIFKRACLLFITLYISTLNIISYLPTQVTSRKVVHSFKKDSGIEVKRLGYFQYILYGCKRPLITQYGR